MKTKSSLPLTAVKILLQKSQFHFMVQQNIRQWSYLVICSLQPIHPTTRRDKCDKTPKSCPFPDGYKACPLAWGRESFELRLRFTELAVI